MTRKPKRFDKVKPQFRSVYCQGCRQRKSCGKLDEKKKYCCACYQKILEELEKDELLISSTQQALDGYRSGIIVCRCLRARKPRMKHLSYDGNGWIKCESKGCEKLITSAGHHGVIKNRNDPKFWGLEVKEKILCGNCLKNLVGKMPVRKKYLFREYEKRGYWQ